MNFDFQFFLEKKCLNAKPVFTAIRGSHAYGTSLPTSDVDYSGIFIQPIDDILSTRYIPQISDEKNDITFYEIRRFLELLAVNNPTVLELLYTPEDCIIYKHKSFDYLLNQKSKFITKICSKSFAGYASTQIKKAKGQDKKQNWESGRVERKTPFDFCYLLKNEKSIPLNLFLSENQMDQSLCGLSKIPHSKDIYSLFYDSDNKFGYRGICFENSNDIRLSSIPIDRPDSSFIGYISYNKDSYTQHCIDYKSYQTWIEKRNLQRWVDVKSHGQKIDGKNMMHCRRLLEMAKEIAEGKGILVKRENAEYLIGIRKGNIDLQTLIDKAESDIKAIEELFSKSNLPDEVDPNLIDTILLYIRKQFYFNK